MIPGKRFFIGNGLILVISRKLIELDELYFPSPRVLRSYISPKLMLTFRRVRTYIRQEIQKIIFESYTDPRASFQCCVKTECENQRTDNDYRSKNCQVVLERIQIPDGFKTFKVNLNGGLTPKYTDECSGRSHDRKNKLPRVKNVHRSRKSDKVPLALRH